MANDGIKYSSQALVGTNKTGTLKPDEDGYYTLVVGALDVFNSAGAFYPLDTAKRLFDSSSNFMRRVKDGNCKGETGHPKRTPGMTQTDFLHRVMTIEETNVCCHFKSFELNTTDVKDNNGRPVVAIIAEVKPAGPQGPALKEALENKHENVCFSIRSLTRDVRQPTGIVNKNISDIVCFDWVTEPGISVAKKYHSPALEGMGLESNSEPVEEVSITLEHIDSIEKKNALGDASMESTAVILSDLKAELVREAKAVTKTTPSLNW